MKIELKTNTNLLKAKRTEYGYNQENMSDFLDITSISYGLKERGEYEFTQTEIVIIGIVLKLSLKEINAIFFDNKITERLKIKRKPNRS